MLILTSKRFIFNQCIRGHIRPYFYSLSQAIWLRISHGSADIVRKETAELRMPYRYEIRFK